eukprot:5501555-Prymnesium_polylepis.1
MWGKLGKSSRLTRTPLGGESTLGEAVNNHVLRERMSVVEMDAMMAREELAREKAGKEAEIGEAEERFRRKEKELKRELKSKEVSGVRV